MIKRIWIVFYIFLAIVVVIIGRLVYLSVFSTSEITSKERLSGNRGVIQDRNGNSLAVSYKTFSLWGNSSLMSEYEKRFLSKVINKELGISEVDVLRRLEKNSRFVWIVRKIPEDRIENVFRITNEFVGKFRKNNVIGLREEYIRRYPLDEKASTVVGSVNIDNEGISGFEYSFNDILLERNGKLGKVKLTIDKYIQEITYIELMKSVKEFEADLGIAVFAKKNGEILSMADYPSFDPNNLSVIPFSSRATGYIIEPGSVMKLASMSFALMNFPNIENSIFECNGVVKIYDHTIKELPHGKVSLMDIIAYSCNVGMTKVISSFDEKSFYFFLRNLGFGDKTAVGLPGEEKGIFRTFNEWSKVSKYMVGIGQEIGVTGIQLLKLGLIIANDGVNVSPKLIKEITLPDGEKKVIRYSEDIRIIPQDICKKIREYMRAGVEYGTGKLADINGVMVGGKTGTGQIYNPKGGYYKDSYNAVFLGIVPYDTPRIVGIVILVNPKKLRQGGTSSAPTFKNILEKILAYDPSLIQTQ